MLTVLLEMLVVPLAIILEVLLIRFFFGGGRQRLRAALQAARVRRTLGRMAPHLLGHLPARLETPDYARIAALEREIWPDAALVSCPRCGRLGPSNEPCRRCNESAAAAIHPAAAACSPHR